MKAVLCATSAELGADAAFIVEDYASRDETFDDAQLYAAVKQLAAL